MSDEGLNREDDLLRAFLAGGPAASSAFTDLCRLLTPIYLGRLRSHGASYADAQEVVQRLFVKLWHARAKLAAPRSARAYLFGALLNEWKSWLRQLQVRRRREPTAVDALHPELDDFSLAERSGGPLDELEALAEEMNRVRQQDCLGRAFQEFGLRFPERALAVEKQELENWAIDEIAAVLGRTYAATKQFLSTSRKSLKAFVLERCRDLMEEG